MSLFPGGKKSKADVAIGDCIAVQVGDQKVIVCKTNGTDVLCKELLHEWLGASRWQFGPEKAGTFKKQNGSWAMKQFIEAHRGDKLAIFPSYRIVCSCVQRSVTKWEQPALQLLEHYHTQTELASSHLISVLLADSDTVRSEQFFKKTSKRVLKKLQVSARQELKLLLQQETRPDTQDKRLYDELNRLCKKVLMPDWKLPFSMEIGVVE